MDFQRIAVFQPGRAGDFILTTPLCDAIKRHLPRSELTLIVGPRAAQMARAHPAIDRVWVFDRAPHKLAALALRLLAHRFDLWLDPKIHPSRNGAMAATLARAREKVGYNGLRLRPFTTDLAAWPDPGDHYIDQVLGCLRPAGIPIPTEPRPTLGLTSSAESWAAGHLPGAGRMSVLVNVSAGNPTRYWTAARWVDLLRAIAGEQDSFLLSSAPEDDLLGKRIVDEARAAGVSVGQLPRSGLLELAALVRSVDLVLTVDTSFVHLAAVFDRPIVALYKYAQPEMTLFAPRSAMREVVISAPGEAVADIPVAAVIAAVRRLRNRTLTAPGTSRRR